MTPEDEEFERIAREIQRNSKEDDDIQDYKRPWVGLTDGEQQQAYEQWQNDGWGVFYNAIEAKLKEKNT